MFRRRVVDKLVRRRVVVSLVADPAGSEKALTGVLMDAGPDGFLLVDVAIVLPGMAPAPTQGSVYVPLGNVDYIVEGS